MQRAFLICLLVCLLLAICVTVPVSGGGYDHEEPSSTAPAGPSGPEDSSTAYDHDHHDGDDCSSSSTAAPQGPEDSSTGHDHHDGDDCSSSSTAAPQGPEDSSTGHAEDCSSSSTAAPQGPEDPVDCSSSSTAAPQGPEEPAEDCSSSSTAAPQGPEDPADCSSSTAAPQGPEDSSTGHDHGHKDDDCSSSTAAPQGPEDSSTGHGEDCSSSTAAPQGPEDSSTGCDGKDKGHGHGHGHGHDDDGSCPDDSSSTGVGPGGPGGENPLYPSELEAAAGDNDRLALFYACHVQSLHIAFYDSFTERWNATDFIDAYYTEDVWQQVQIIAAHKQDQWNTLNSTLATINATWTCPIVACNYTFNVTDVQSFLTVAKELESTAVSAYIGSITALTNPELQTLFASISTVIARHSAYLNSVVIAITEEEPIPSSSTGVVGSTGTNVPGLPTPDGSTAAPEPVGSSTGLPDPVGSSTGLPTPSSSTGAVASSSGAGGPIGNETILLPFLAYPVSADLALAPGLVWEILGKHIEVGSCDGPELPVIRPGAVWWELVNITGNETVVEPDTVYGYTPAHLSNDLDALNYALFIEHVEAAFYAYGQELFNDTHYEAENLTASFDYLDVIREHELSRIELLIPLIEARNGTAIEACVYNFSMITNATLYLTIAHQMENAIVSAFDGGLNRITDTNLQQLIASISTVEARHATYLAKALGLDVFANATDVTMSPEEALALSSDFIVNCTTAPPVPGIPTPSIPIIYRPIESSSSSSTGASNGSSSSTGPAGPDDTFTGCSPACGATEFCDFNGSGYLCRPLEFWNVTDGELGGNMNATILRLEGVLLIVNNTQLYNLSLGNGSVLSFLPGAGLWVHNLESCPESATIRINITGAGAASLEGLLPETVLHYDIETFQASFLFSCSIELIDGDEVISVENPNNGEALAAAASAGPRATWGTSGLTISYPSASSATNVIVSGMSIVVLMISTLFAMLF